MTENEIFVYDRQYTSEGGEPDVHQTPLPDPFDPENPPDTLANQNDLQAWRNLFLARRTWALSIAECCLPIQDAVQQLDDERDIIRRAVCAAVENLKGTIASLEMKFEEAQNWANETLNDQRAALDGWQQYLHRTKQIQIKKDFTFLLQRPSTPKKAPGRATGTLEDLIDVSEIKAAGVEGARMNEFLAKQLEDSEKAVNGLLEDTQALIDDVQPAISAGEDIVGLIEELETHARKVSSDVEFVLGQPNNQKTLSNVSKMALNHTRNLLPALRDIGLETHAAWIQAVHQRNDAVTTAIRQMKTIAMIQSAIPAVKGTLFAMEDYDPGEVFQTIDSIFQLPTLYGSVLIEAVRRREWNEKMKSDSAALAEEMAIFKEEEQRRRKKWARNMGDFIVGSADDNNTISIEVDVQGKEESWPEVSRDDINAYIEDLKSQPSMSQVILELNKLLKELDTPTRQQRRRAKAFKQGSVYDAELGRSSLLLRGDDMVRSLKDDKTRLEERLKGSESRIRKLEDLLHRQSQISRPASGTLVHDSSAAVVGQVPSSPSPRPDFPSRRSSASSRRPSANQSLEEKALVQRIVSLEAHLMSERDTVARLQKEAHAERRNSTESKDKMLEAETTKKDLLENVRAQQREFDAERRSLETEIKKYKQKLEEVEDEIDRMLGSRDNERLGGEERVRDVLAEMEKMRRETSEEVEKANGQVDFIRHDATLQRDKANALERQMTQLKELNAELKAKFDEEVGRASAFKDMEADYVGSLQAAHGHLAPEGSAPEDLKRLTRAVEMLAEGLAIHARNADSELALLQAEHRDLEERSQAKDSEVEQLKESLTSIETDLLKVNEALAQEQTRYTSLKAQFDDEQTQLNMLRSKFAAGETGSEALKDRVAEEEGRVADLAEKLALAESQAKNLEDEADLWKRKAEEAGLSEREAHSRLDERGAKAKELSQRLCTQTDRMGRMLEQLGLMVTRQDDSMVIQKAPKTSTQSSTGNIDSLVKSTVSSPTVPGIVNLDLLYWIQENADLESSKFSSFMSNLDTFDLDVVSEAVVKRVKEKDLLARKWHREAQNYRDKSHKLAGEAHDKIAYRSFKEGDIALFLPTRNQSIRSWAAFNVGAPHYFLREQDAHKLHTRDWLLARISKIEERVVDLSRSMQGATSFNSADRRSLGEASDAASSMNIEDDNPFDLSDGLRWYLVDAAEEKPGAPTTPGLGKSTVASAKVDARAVRTVSSARGKNATSANLSAATKTLSKSLDTRRESSSSTKKVVAGLISGLQERHGRTSSVASSVISGKLASKASREDTSAAANVNAGEGSPAVVAAGATTAESSAAAGEATRKPNTADIEVQPSPPPEEEESPATQAEGQPSTPAKPARDEGPVFEQVRRDLLWGP